MLFIVDWLDRSMLHGHPHDIIDRRIISIHFEKIRRFDLKIALYET